jgi:hypothetical protein
MPARSILLLDLLKKCLEYERATAQEDSVVLEEYLEGFSGDLSVEEEVFVVEDQ